MPNESTRINTLIALITGSGSVSAAALADIKTELHEIIAANRVSPQHRKFILKILHTTRSVDSTLKAFLTTYHVVGTKHSIGSYLHQLERNTSPSLHRISSSERAHYQEEIAKVRNDHMHNANRYPRTERKVNELINEMHALMARVFALPK
jgi:hypothetical protein